MDEDPGLKGATEEPPASGDGVTMYLAVIFILFCVAASLVAAVLAHKRHQRLVEQGIPDAEAKPSGDVDRLLARYRMFASRNTWQFWGVTNAYAPPGGHPDDTIFFAGTSSSRVLGLGMHDPSIPEHGVSVAGTTGSKLDVTIYDFVSLDRWPWSDGRRTVKLRASRHRDDTTTTAEQARVWADAAFTACAACDLPRPLFVEFADAGVLFVFRLHKTKEHLDRVANLHAMIRERGGVGGMAAG